MLAFKQILDISLRVSQNIVKKAKVTEVLNTNSNHTVSSDSIRKSMVQKNATIALHKCIRLTSCLNNKTRHQFPDGDRRSITMSSMAITTTGVGTKTEEKTFQTITSEKSSSSLTRNGNNHRSRRTRRLALLFGWLMARDDHLEKYRQLYLSKGFDVLTVDASLASVGLPTLGAQVLAEQVMSFLKANNHEYRNIVAHGFSTGGYQFGEFLVQLRKELENDVVSPRDAQKVLSSIRGMIFDSLVDLPGVPHGLSNLIAPKTPFAPVLSQLVHVYLKISPATRCYATASNVLHNMYVKCPTLFLVSRTDLVARIEDNEKAARDLRNVGIDVTWREFKSNHVQHYHQHPREYEHEINTFLTKIGLFFVPHNFKLIYEQRANMRSFKDFLVESSLSLCIFLFFILLYKISALKIGFVMNVHIITLVVKKNAV